MSPEQKPPLLFQITAPHFCAAGEIQQDAGQSPEVVTVAPIIKYMKGWSARRVKEYCESKKWEVKRA